jgi:hypothetical protein
LSANTPSGAFWTTGVHLVPGPRTDLTLRYGQRYGEPYENGALTYRIFSNMRLTAGYDIALQTEQENFANALRAVTVDGDGNIVNGVTGLAANPNQLGTGLVNAVYRSRTLKFGVGGTHGLDFFALTGQSTLRFYGGAQPDDRSAVINLTLGRALDPVTTASATVVAGDTKTNAASATAVSASSANFLTSLDVSHRLSETTTLSVEVTRRQQNGAGGADEDVAIIRFNHKF